MVGAFVEREGAMMATPWHPFKRCPLKKQNNPHSEIRSG
jgi:hypothetical protein